MDCGNSVELMTTYATKKPKSKMSPRYLKSMEKQAEKLFGVKQNGKSYEENVAKGFYNLARY